MNLFRRSAVLLLWMAIAAASLPATEPSRLVAKATAAKTVRVLAIGNSFSHDATTFLGKLAAADGHRLILKTATIGGSPLQLHWDKAQLHEHDPSDRKGLYGNGQGLKQILRDGPHDFVTIQQRSSISHDAATYRPYAAKMQAYVKQHAPEAELLVHETWAYRVDDRRFTSPSLAPGEPRTQREMYEQLAKAYRTIATELRARLIPVGDAFYAADTDGKWGYKPDATFNPKQASAPGLPDQARSLHVGYKWQMNPPAAPTLSMDGHHSSPAGRYLGACVWYEVLFATSCVGNAFTAGLDADYARFLQETAHRAVAAAN